MKVQAKAGDSVLIDGRIKGVLLGMRTVAGLDLIKVAYVRRGRVRKESMLRKRVQVFASEPEAGKE